MAYFLPRNSDLDQAPRTHMRAIARAPACKRTCAKVADLDAELGCEIEHNFLNDKVKSITVYFGGLAPGDENQTGAP